MSAKGQRREQPARGPTQWGSTATASRRKEADTLACVGQDRAGRPPPQGARPPSTERREATQGGRHPSGSLYLVPNLLGAVPPSDVLPARTIAIARTISHWVVETPKPARAFLKSLDLPAPVAELAIEALGEAPDAAHLGKLIAVVREGDDLGMLSDAGCPGVADPGAALVAAAHAANLRVVPLVGPSAVLLALMAAGMNGQRFAFHGYLPTSAEGRAQALRKLEADARAQRCTQIFIETPYRNVAMLGAIVDSLAPATRVCVAADLTLATETITTRPVRDWRGRDASVYAKRPAIFLLGT